MVDLKLIIEKNPSCLANSGTVKGILMDCGLERRTVQVMINLYDCGIVDKIHQCGGILSQLEVYNITAEQENYYGTSQKFISDGISRWAEVLGAKVEGSQSLKIEDKMQSELQSRSRGVNQENKQYAKKESISSSSPQTDKNGFGTQQPKSENPFVTQFRASQKQPPKSENPFVVQFRASQTNESAKQFQQPSKNPVIRGFCGSNKVNEYSKDSGDGKNVSWVYDGNGILTISGIGKIADYYIGDVRPWERFKDEITTVIISKGIRKVGKNAFWFCSRLENLVLPEGMRTITIGEDAFYGCVNLSHVTSPASLTVESDAFGGCPKLRREFWKKD